MIIGADPDIPYAKTPMQTRTKNRAILHYRAQATLWLAIAALILLPPFAFNHFVQERYILGVVVLIVIFFLGLVTWTIYRGHYMPALTVFGLVPALIGCLAHGFPELGMIAAMWCYPCALVLYFILPGRQAIIASLCMLVLILPSAWFILDPYLAIRFAVTLTAVTVFSGVFVFIIERQQQELEKKEAMLRDTMASASHELRTPLATLVAQIEAMRDGIRPLDQQQLTLLSHSVDHFNDLVSDLYLLSLADVSALFCNKTLTRLDKILHEAVDSVRSKLADHNLLVEIKRESLIEINGDAKRLRQIIDNLLENCYRYCSPGGKITIKIKQHAFRVELSITDTGPGVSDAELPLLFNRFYRVDQSRSREKGGTGLGLSLVKALAEAHGGHVKAFHAAEGGLGISVTLPLLNAVKQEEKLEYEFSS